MKPLPTEMTFVIHHEDGWLWTQVPSLPGCFASGRNIAELEQAIAESISAYLADSPEERQAYSVQLSPSPPRKAAEIPARVRLAAA